MRKKYSDSLINVLVAFLLLVVTLISCYRYTPSAVYAASSGYSDVLTDLKSDSSFKTDDYNLNGHDLQLITVAESEDKELFVYVLQPEDSQYNATYIRLSSTVGDNFSPNDYSLTFLNSSGNFVKYLVNGFTVKDDVVRYYNITCIFREWISGVDVGADEETLNYITQTPFEVAKCYTATTLNGEVSYTVEETEVVTITGKYVGFVRYSEGAYLWDALTDVDRHFVAFSCDYDIDKLYEADIKYSSHDYTLGIHGNGYGVQEDEDTVTYGPITLYDTDEGSNVGGGVFGKTYSWKRIESTSDFLAEFDDVNFEWTDGATSGLSSTQWVLSFVETDVDEYVSSLFSKWSGGTVREATKVDEVSILRLKFVVDGVTYNLGVVDNYQSNSSYTSSGGSTASSFFKTLTNSIVEKIILFVLIGLALVLCIILFPQAFIFVAKVIAKVIVWIFKLLLLIIKAIWYIVLLPFRLIGAVFKRFKKNDKRE